MNPINPYKTIASGVMVSIFTLLNVAPSQASVVVSGTRVIYPADAKMVSIQLSNHDDFPNAVQAWVDIDNPSSMPTDADAPFVVTPSIARLAPRGGQQLRIVFAGANAPTDRESLFHLNVLQIPPFNSTTVDQNQVMFLMQNRLKLFYRPPGIVGSPAQLPEKLRFSLEQSSDGWHVRVDNPTGYYASFGSATLSVGATNWTLGAGMVPPMASSEWRPAMRSALPVGEAVLSSQLINDYGARVPVRHVLPR